MWTPTFDCDALYSRGKGTLETLANGHAPRLPQLLPDAAKKRGRMQALTMDSPDVQKYLEMCTIPGVTPFGMPDPEDA